MKNCSLLLTFLLLLSGVNAQRNADVEHYEFKIRVTDVSDLVIGEAAIRVRFGNSVSSFKLDFAKMDNKGIGMVVDSVLGPNIKEISEYSDSLVIHFQAPITNDTATYIVRYHGVPGDGLIISRNKFGHRSFFADNWPNRGHKWIPCVDEPGDKASVEFIVVAPHHYQVVSNGILIEETNIADNWKLTHWKEDVPISTKVMVIGIADFAVSLAGTIAGCVPVYSWVYPEDRDKGFFDYAQAMGILPFYIGRVGPYGFKKLANVQSKTTFGGLENANTIFYAENTIDGTRHSESLMAHEIAHQWFGNMATEKTFAHLWLSEGFATYMTVLYMENKYGKDTATKMLKEDRRQVIEFARSSTRPVVDEVSTYMELLNANSYQKGGWILHMLRRQLGDSAFTQSVRKYYATYAGKTADTRDLQRVFETVSRRDLSAFFQQWLYTPGIPVVDLQWSFDRARRKIRVTVKQEQDKAFQFPLEIGISFSNSKKSKVERMQVKNATTVFEFDATEKPTEVIADPQCSLLADISVHE